MLDFMVLAAIGGAWLLWKHYHPRDDRNDN